MIDKFFSSTASALDGVHDDSVVMVGGFGTTGQPNALLEGLIERGVRNLTIVANNAGSGHRGLARILELGMVRKIICSFPRGTNPVVFETLYSAGKLELEIVPQGTLAERIRAAGAGVAAFYTPTGVGTILQKNKEIREINGRNCLLEHALCADLALIEAWKADRWGNLIYKSSARNFNPIMAMAARLTVAQTQHVAGLGELDPESIVTPGIFVDRVVHVPYGNPKVLV